MNVCACFHTYRHSVLTDQSSHHHCCALWCHCHHCRRAVVHCDWARDIRKLQGLQPACALSALLAPALRQASAGWHPAHVQRPATGHQRAHHRPRDQQPVHQPGRASQCQVLALLHVLSSLRMFDVRDRWPPTPLRMLQPDEGTCSMSCSTPTV